MTARMDRRFAALRDQGRAALMTFTMAGDPDYEGALAILKALPAAGADIIELGMPFTDPMADGPAIQAAGLRALAGGQTLKKTLALVRDFRSGDEATPVVLMGYYNPIYIYGVDRFLADAAAGRHPVSFCLALMWCGCMTALRVGDFETAERSSAQLQQHAERYGLKSYYGLGVCFQGRLMFKRGDFAAAEQLHRQGLAHFRQAQFEAAYTVFLSSLAEVLIGLGQLDEALASAADALRRAERANVCWWLPQAIMVKGAALWACSSDAAAAEAHFRQSLGLARGQGALSLELLAVDRLARLLLQQKRTEEALDCLQPVYDRFTEGFATPSLVSTKQFLDEITQAR